MATLGEQHGPDRWLQPRRVAVAGGVLIAALAVVLATSVVRSDAPRQPVADVEAAAPTEQLVDTSPFLPLQAPRRATAGTGTVPASTRASAATGTSGQASTPAARPPRTTPAPRPRPRPRPERRSPSPTPQTTAPAPSTPAPTSPGPAVSTPAPSTPQPPSTATPTRPNTPSPPGLVETVDDTVDSTVETVDGLLGGSKDGGLLG